MGAGKSTGARTLAAELGAEPLDSDRELERRLGEPIEAFFDREGEARLSRARGGAGARAARRPTRAVIALGGGALRLRARARGAARRTPSFTSRCGRGRMAASVRQGPAARARPRPLRAAPARPEPALRGAWRTPCSRRRIATACGARCRRSGARRGAGGHPPRVGRGGLRRVPGVPGPRADRVRLLLPTRRAAVRGHRRERRPVATASRATRAIVVIARRGAQDDRTAPSSCCASSPSRTRERGDLVVAVGGGVVGDVAGFCAAIYQRGMRRRAGPDDARGAGRLRLRRQDRRGPARGEELRRAPTTSPSAVLVDPAALDTLPRRGAPPATPRWSRPR